VTWRPCGTGLFLESGEGANGALYGTSLTGNTKENDRMSRTRLMSSVRAKSRPKRITLQREADEV
jgi:hypothetical protein